MDLGSIGAIFLGTRNLGLVPGELGQQALGLFVGGEIVGVRNIGYGYALGAVVAAYPVGVGQIDTDGGSGIRVPRQAHRIDNLGADTLDL